LFVNESIIMLKCDYMLVYVKYAKGYDFVGLTIKPIFEVY